MPRPSRSVGDVGQREDRYLSLRELSKYAGISVSTLRGYVTRTVNPLPHFRMAGKAQSGDRNKTSMILVKQSEFDKWMQQFSSEREAERIAKIADQLMESFR